MYEAEPDPYCYPNSSVLKNKGDHRSHVKLEEFETAMTIARSQELLPAGRLSVTHYKAIHHHLFQDVYSWAGRFRTVRLAKGDSSFCYPEYIDQEMKSIFSWLKAEHFLTNRSARDFFAEAAHFLAYLNAIHPFREGNGRTQLAFFALLADHAGHQVDLDSLEPKAMLEVMIKSFNGDEAPLAEYLTTLCA